MIDLGLNTGLEMVLVVVGLVWAIMLLLVPFMVYAILKRCNEICQCLASIQQAVMGMRKTD